MKDKMKIMFVCHGNICRSPMAEMIFRDMLRQRGMTERFEVCSRATSTEEIGNPVYPPAREELLRHGLTCEGKRSVQVIKQDYDRYDLLICMDQRNIQNLLRIVGADTKNKIRLLMDFTPYGGEVADPWFFGNFDRTYQQIEEGCRFLLEYLTDTNEF